MCRLSRFMGRSEILWVARRQYEHVVKQMRDFKTVKRTDDDGNMASASKTLSDRDIEELVYYLAALD